MNKPRKVLAEGKPTGTREPTLFELTDSLTNNGVLWHEFKTYLAKNHIVTNYGAKEYLIKFLNENKIFKDHINLTDKHVNDSEINLCKNFIKDKDKKTAEHKSFIASLLRKNKIFPGKMDPFETPLNNIQTKSKSLPLFDSKEIKLGNKLGNGSQSVVYEVKSFSSTHSNSLFNKQNQEWTWKNDHDKKPDFVCSNSLNKEHLPQSFAVKIPRHDTKTHKENVEELLHESNILLHFDHPNIIKIHGMSAIRTYQSGSNISTQHFFLVLDRLLYTLGDLLKIWVSKKNISDIFKFQTFKDDSFGQRLKIALTIATAMKHIHEKNIMHRDLKPENIGFDSQGKLKLFDFGFATKLLAMDRLYDGKYKLEGGKGTCRYMAPEVARHESYNELADVYSFGILLWEILALEKPYKSLDCTEWLNKVIFNGMRPNIDNYWPAKLQHLLSSCWSEDINERPNFDIIVDVLDEIILLY